MTLVDLKSQLVKDKKLNHLYIFTGEESTVLNVYVKKVTDLFETITKGNVKKIDSLGQVYTSFSKANLLKSKPCCYIIREDKEFSSQSESVWKSIRDKKLLKDNVVILIYNNIDKKTKFYKYFSNYITIFDVLNMDLLSKYVVKQLSTLSINNAKYLVDICRNSYTRILLECDKLKHLRESLNFKDDDSCFEYALSQNFIYIPPEDALFSFVTSCLDRNIDDCYYYLNECKLGGQIELNILANLYTNFRALFQVQCVGYSKEICDITGLQMYQVKNVSNKTKNYSLEELLRALRLIHYCETSIKNGTMEPDMVVDYMLVNLL